MEVGFNDPSPHNLLYKILDINPPPFPPPPLAWMFLLAYIMNALLYPYSKTYCVA